MPATQVADPPKVATRDRELTHITSVHHARYAGCGPPEGGYPKPRAVACCIVCPAPVPAGHCNTASLQANGPLREAPVTAGQCITASLQVDGLP